MCKFKTALCYLHFFFYAMCTWRNGRVSSAHVPIRHARRAWLYAHAPLPRMVKKKTYNIKIRIFYPNNGRELDSID